MVSMYPKAEILSPPKLIPSLADLRGPEWSELVSDVSKTSETHPDTLAFCLMMIELNGCLNCYAGSYKFMRGCAACARQTVTQYKGTDKELLRLFKKAQQEVTAYLADTHLATLTEVETLQIEDIIERTKEEVAARARAEAEARQAAELAALAKAAENKADEDNENLIGIEEVGDLEESEQEEEEEEDEEEGDEEKEEED